MSSPIYSPEVIYRLHNRTVKTSGCWEWVGWRSPEGYGKMKAQGKMKFAHRLMYEVERGEIPDGMVIDHLCRNRGCVNPNHLEAVTRGTNAIRGNTPIAENAAKTHCHKGHPLMGDNLKYEFPNGQRRRRCRTCHRDNNTKYRERKNELRPNS